jgi:hypothetical protein
MSFLANNTRVSSLTINGVDYTSAFLEWQVSDLSAYKNGCIQTTGRLTLGTYRGGPIIEDYDRDNFRRGVPVVLDLVEPGGSTYRHPRGYLHVISVNYDVESEQLQVELGCRLVLMALTERIDDLLSIVPIPLDVAQETYPNCSAAFASAGKYVYQTNTGTLAIGTLFDGDSYNSFASGEWISVLGVTTESVAPLAGTEAIPDEIKLSYQVPEGLANTDNRGQVDTVEETSYYFVRYPATIYVRKNSDATSANPNGTLGNITTVATGSATGSGDNACGNSPDQPADNGSDGTTNDSCNDGYRLTQESLYLPATRTTTTVTTYDAPGAQVSKVQSELRGPAVEANNQYFADKFAYCRSVWATACQPNASCPYEGMNEILLGYQSVNNYYGEANELVKTVLEQWVPTLSAAQPSNWRSGVSNGVPQDFNQNVSLTDMYRDSRVETTYYRENNVNVQKVETYRSIASRGSGISTSIDALQGIKTTNIRKSSSNTTVDSAPDRVNGATTSLKEKEASLPLFSGRYRTPPTESGPYILKEQIPIPLLLGSDTEISAALATYENYIERCVKGDAFGLQLGESLRSEIVTNWRPGMPFRYCDPSKNKIVAMRMDATTWGVSRDESAFVTNGLWIGFSNGTLTIPSNLVGDSRPDMGSGTQPPVAPVSSAIVNETSIDSGSFSWNVDVELQFSCELKAYGNDGIVPVIPLDLSYNAYATMTCFAEGAVVAAGDLLATDGTGSVPLEYAGSLVVTDATVVDADLFS